jgi:hypothetical protein
MLVFLLGSASNVQAAGYTPSITTAYPALTINPSAPQVVWASCNSVGGGMPSAYALCDDGVSQIMPIGFAFNFAGTSYTNWSMSSNGAIFFETAAVGGTSTATAFGTSTYTPSNLPSTGFGSPAKPALMPFWADLQHNLSIAGANNNPAQPANASFYQYQVLTQPSGAKVLVVQLKNVVYWNTSPQLYVNLQVQIWSTGEIVYSYGAMLANNQTTALSNQSFLYQWDAAAPACPALSLVNHYEIRQDRAATLCAEPVTVLACAVSTTPCPTASIMGSQIITLQLTVSGVPATPSATNPNRSPPSANLQPTAPLQNFNLTWAAGSSGTATLGISAAVTASSNAVCTNTAGTASHANCNMTVTNTACIAPPHHYQIIGPASGSTCATNTFTIKAWADAAETIPYTAAVATGTLNFTGNAASLPSLGAFTIPAGGSTVNITPISFPAGGTTTFNTTTTPALAGATTCNFGGSTSCAFPVITCVADFNCVEVGADSATGRLYTKLAGTAFSVDVMARKADGTVVNTYASDTAKPITVELVDGSGATACTSRSALSPAVSVTQNFVAADAGRKSFGFTVANAVRDVRCRVTDSNQTPNVVSCSTDNFAIRPSAVTLNTTASAAAPSATATPTIKAGANFTLSATTSAGTNYTPVLTQDTSKRTAQDPTQTMQASGGSVGTLTPSSLTVNAAAVNATYREVGYLYLAAGAYYDAANPAFTAVDASNGDCIVGSFSDTLVGGQYGCSIGNAIAVSLGRFIPDHFDTAILGTATAPIPCPAGLTCPTNASGANGLIYATQPFTVQVTAKNAAGITTTNYRSHFSKATTLSAWNAAGGATANPGSGSFSNTALAATAFASGVGSTAVPSYALGSVTTAPTNVFIRATENTGGDGVTSNRISSKSRMPMVRKN